MSSHSVLRPFSQGLDMSQMTLPLMNEQSSNHLTDQVDHLQPTEASQQDLPEEHLSLRANSICEENRQIRTYVESTLKQLEKRRLKLINKKNSIEEQWTQLSETNERQKQVSLELQMNLEEITEQYQSELQRRPQLFEKLVRIYSLECIYVKVSINH